MLYDAETMKASTKYNVTNISGPMEWTYSEVNFI